MSATHRLLAEYDRTPWALMPERYHAYRAVLLRWESGATASDDIMRKVASDRDVRDARRAASTRAAGGGVGVLPLYGCLTQRGNAMDDLSGPGSISTEMFGKALRALVADDSVGSILIDIDSPGGSVYGAGELADEIFEARKAKPVVGIANSLCASAAYWLGSQCSELYVTPGGEVGSIGVIMAHVDYSKANEMEGVRVSYIVAGQYKAEGNSNEPLSAEARAYEQSRVNDYYSAFIKAVARGRGVPVAAVRSDAWGGGRVLGARDALAEKLVDGVMPFDAALKRARELAKSPASAKSVRATPAQVRAEHSRRRLRIAALD
jgi:signal peptide peptidase SppA